MKKLVYVFTALAMLGGICFAAVSAHACMTGNCYQNNSGNGNSGGGQQAFRIGRPA